MWFRAACALLGNKIGGKGCDRRLRYNAPPGASFRRARAGSLVGFAMALPGVSRGASLSALPHAGRQPRITGNLGIGRRLKLFQRDEALARGIARMEWTFDPQNQE